MGDSDSECSEEELDSSGKLFEKMELIPELSSYEVIRQLVPPTILTDPKIWWDNHKAKFKFNLEPEEVESLQSNPDWDMAIQVIQYSTPDGPLQEFSGQAVLKIEGKSCDLEMKKSLGKPRYIKRIVLKRLKGNSVVLGLKCCMAYEEGIPESLPTLVVSICLVEKVAIIDEVNHANEEAHVVGDTTTEMEVINRTHIPKEVTMGQIKDTIIEDYQNTKKTYMKISVICPLTKTRLVQPVRYSACAHVECFELGHFLHLVATTQEFSLDKCPLCETKVKFEDLKIDNVLNSLLNNSDANGRRNPNASFVRMHLNGDWEWEQDTPDCAEEFSNAVEAVEDVNPETSDEVSSPVDTVEAVEDVNQVGGEEGEIVEVVDSNAKNSRVNFVPHWSQSSEPGVNAVRQRAAITTTTTLIHVYNNIVERRLPGHVKVSVICKLSGNRINYPAKFKTCTHVECFDLEAYFRAIKTSVIEKHKCPICNAAVKYEDLAIDELLSSILQLPDSNNSNFSNNTFNVAGASVVVFPSGRWVWDNSSADAKLSASTVEEKFLEQVVRRQKIPKQNSLSTVAAKVRKYGLNFLVLKTICCVSGKRIFRPARFATCLHSQTFDLGPFLESIDLINCPLWANCPLCHVPRELEDLRLDELFIIILYSADRNGVKHRAAPWVRVFGNGEWEWAEKSTDIIHTRSTRNPASSRPAASGNSAYQQQPGHVNSSKERQGPQRNILRGTHEKIMNEVMQRDKIKKEITLWRVRKIIKQDSEMTGLTYLRVGIKCPITTSRLTHPVRFRTCTHIHCFELDAFLQMVKASTRFSFEKCPICEAEVRFSDLMGDEIFENILRAPDKKGILDKECGFVRIFEDGTWEWDTQKSKTVAIEAINVIDLDADTDETDNMDEKDNGSDANTKLTEKDPRPKTLESAGRTKTSHSASDSISAVTASQQPELITIAETNDDDWGTGWESYRIRNGQSGNATQAALQGPSGSSRKDSNNNSAPAPTPRTGSKQNSQPQPPPKAPPSNAPSASALSAHALVSARLTKKQRKRQAALKQAEFQKKMKLASANNWNNTNANLAQQRGQNSSAGVIKLSKKERRRLRKQQQRSWQLRLRTPPPPSNLQYNNYYQHDNGNGFNFNNNMNGSEQWAPNPHHSWNQRGSTTIVSQLNVNFNGGFNWGQGQAPPPLMSPSPAPTRWGHWPGQNQNPVAEAWERASVDVPQPQQRRPWTGYSDPATGN